MNTPSCLVSIIIPVYNVEKYLLDCLNSCFCQSYSNIEVIAIDDGSPDNCGQILDHYAKTEFRLRVFHQKNAGVVAARAVGVNNASGGWIMFVDSDDLIDSKAVEDLLAVAKKDQTDIVTGNYEEFHESIDYVERLRLPKYGVITKNEFLELLLTQQIQWGLWARIYNRSLFSQVINTEFKLGEDASLLVQLVEKCQRISFVDRNIYTYRQRANSAVHLKSNPSTRDIYLFRCWIEDYLTTKSFVNANLLDLFVVSGYIECLFAGGKRFLSKEDYNNVSIRYRRIEKQLSIWQQMLYKTSNIIGVHQSMLMLLRIAQKLNFIIKRRLNKFWKD